MNAFEVLENSRVSVIPVAPVIDAGLIPASPQPVSASETFRHGFEVVMDELAADYQEGTRDFIREHNPSLLAELRSVDDEMIAAWRNGDFPTFEEALGQWKQIHETMIRLFEEY